MEGYIYLHRRLQGHWLNDSKEPMSRFEAWIWILFEANFKDNKTLIDGVLVGCDRGQLITSIASLATAFRWSSSRVRSFLKLLEKDGMIEREGLRKCTKITICKYDSYQNKSQADRNEIALTSHPDRIDIASRSHSDRNTRSKGIKGSKEIKGIKGNKERARAKFQKPSESEIESYMVERECAAANFESKKFFNHYESNGWKVGKNPMKDWKAAVRNWLSRDYGKSQTKLNGRRNRAEEPQHGQGFGQL